MISEEIGERLGQIHMDLCKDHDALCRIAVAVYDAETDLLKTFAHSTHGAAPLKLYEANLAEVPSLAAIAASGKPRTVADILEMPHTEHVHSERIREAGYRSSLTFPILHRGTLFGFLFFNATRAGYFSAPRIRALGVYAQLISVLIVNELLPLGTLRGAVKTAREFSRQRDEETGDHLERMSRYARLIARNLARRKGLEDWWVEYLFQFAPLHDVGKVAIPDSILLKPGPLDDAEYRTMKTHVSRGLQIVDAMMSGFGLHAVQHVDMLRNIVAHHHEMLDGSGYPDGLKGDAIPLEARIVAIADVYDALTSTRPYKAPWDNGQAVAHLKQFAGIRYDAECVAALLDAPDEIVAIQRAFEEDPLG